MSMSGWSILSVVGPQTFPFPSYTLNPGAAVTVHSGPDAPASGGDNLRWTTGYIWNNDGDEAQLKNPQGGVVDIDDCCFASPAPGQRSRWCSAKNRVLQDDSLGLFCPGRAAPRYSTVN